MALSLHRTNSKSILLLNTLNIKESDLYGPKEIVKLKNLCHLQTKSLKLLFLKENTGNLNYINFYFLIVIALI